MDSREKLKEEMRKIVAEETSALHKKMEELCEVVEKFGGEMDELSKTVRMNSTRLARLERNARIDSRRLAKLERDIRILESRMGNIRVVQQFVRTNPNMVRQSRNIRPHVEMGKPDHSNYVSDDEIEVLPRYYR